MAIAGVSWWNLYFHLFPGTMRSTQIIEFLTNLHRHIPGKLRGESSTTHPQPWGTVGNSSNGHKEGTPTALQRIAARAMLSFTYLPNALPCVLGEVEMATL
jgi:hypothetical protein